jgi:simple sugar transport system ATP-binding protein
VAEGVHYMVDHVIRIKDVTKRFGDLAANDRVTLDIHRGEILALLGENGAGKSTLMKVLYGLYTRDSGEITVNNSNLPRKFSPSDAIKLGISMVPQHFMLVDSFTIAENIILGEEQRISRFIVNKTKACQQVEKLCEQFGINVSPSQKVEKLPLGIKQKIEILKALYRDTKILILDEPTTVLTPQEVEELFELLRTLQKTGMTIIIITHKLHEVMMVTDRVTVMRHGKIVATFKTANTNVRELSRTMVGADIESVHVDESKEQLLPEPYISLENISTKADGERCNLKNLNLNVYPGRIVGVAGIDGNGQTELVEVLTGVKAIKSGHISANGKRILSNSTEAMRSLGIGVIPEDRSEQGLVLDLSIRENILIGHKDDERFCKYGFFKVKQVDNFVDELIRKYDIRPTRKSAMCRFVSGGNQQKVLLARELERPHLQLVVASQPSRGLDVGAIQFTHQTILKLRNEGKAILLISSDLDEIKTLSDDIAVIRDGTVVACCKSCELSKDEIGLYMGGSNANKVTA